MLARRVGRFLLVLLIGPATAWPTFASEAWIPKAERKPAPRLALRDLEGRTRRLADLKGKVVVVNFWATWCAPCRAEMPEFTKVYAEYRERGVEFIGAANERRSARGKVREFVRELDVQFPIWLEASIDHLEAFGTGPELPATVIVDAEGRVAVRIKGVTDAAQLRTLLDRLLLEANARSGAARPVAAQLPQQPALRKPPVAHHRLG